MIIENRKKDLEIKIYEKEIYEDLQKVYKEKFSICPNQQKYEIFAYETNENVVDYKISHEHSQNKYKKSPSKVIYKNIDAIKSFENFVGKRINIENKYYNGLIKGSEKIKNETVHMYASFCKYNNNDVLSRITEIKNILSNMKHHISSKKKFVNNKKLLLPNILSDLLELDNKISVVIKYGEINDLNFCDNVKYYKYINSFINCKKLNIFQIIQKLKSISSDHKLDKKIKILNFNCMLSTEKKNFYDKFKEIVYKIDNIESLLYEQCFNEKENIACILLSFYLFLSLSLNENINKRMLNYIYLTNLEIKKCKEYLEDERNVKILKMLHDFKSSIDIYYDKKKFMNAFLISLNKDNEILLQLYKKLLDNEISINLISYETYKINSITEKINKSIDENNEMIKSFFSSFHL